MLGYRINERSKRGYDLQEQPAASSLAFIASHFLPSKANVSVLTSVQVLSGASRVVRVLRLANWQLKFARRS
jgi:hypothetical protein